MRTASERIRGRVSVDGLSLSKRIHANDIEAREGLRATLERSIRAGETVTRTAERLLSEDRPLVQLPRYVEELSEAAKLGEPNEYAAAVKRWRSQVERLGQGAERSAGEFTLRSSTQQLIRDLKGAKPEQVDKAVNRWVLDKARYQARVVARHEAVESFRENELAALQQQAWCKGVRWTLSPAHPRPDICDVCAGQDLHGLGPGGYPADDVPERHPSCLCSLVAITDEAHFERELARAKGQEEPPRPWESGERVTGDQWLRRQTAGLREAVAGPTRAKLVMRGQSVMATPGRFEKVHRLLGEPKPVRRAVLVSATKVVAADRANMVRPFPSLK